MSDEDKVEVLVESRVDDVASGAAKSAKVREAETATTVEVRSLKRYTKEEKPSRSIGKILAVGLLAIVLVGGLIGTIVFYNLQPVRRDYQWWHKTTIYQIYPRSFKDSDGDGIGDLKGIESKLDHLKGLGIETIWLSPVFQSPMKDFGYDIENFIAIDKLFGTLDDFKDLMREVKKRELRLIMDFVPNHSSDRHEWFINSTNASEECPEYADYYVWHEGHPRWTVDRNGTTIKAPPNNWLSVFGGPAWTWNEKRRMYYLHQFLASQPDLNWRNPAVVKHMDNAMRFWLDLGVDGFRIDALPFLFEVPHDEMVDKNETSPSPYWPEANLNTNDYEYWLHPYTRNVDPIFEVIKNWTRIMDDYSSKSEKKEPKLLILEVVDKNSSQLVKYYPEDPFGTGAMPFYMGLIFMTDQTDGFAVQKLVEENLDMLPKGAWPNWVIGNHDQRRATGRLGNKDFVDGLNILNLLLPGIPTTYYGEEIGMRDTLINSREEVKDPQGCNFGDEWAKKTRDYCRSPMQWDSHNTSAGFSTNVTTWLPLAPDWNNTINVEYQTSKSSNQTHYSVFKRLIQIRGTPAFQSGTFRHALVTRDIYSFVRESGEQSYLIALDMRRNSSGDPSKDRVKYDFTGGAAKLTGKGRVVTASVNLYPKGGAPAPENSIASYGTTEEINLTSVELIPASAVVLRITPA